MIEKAGEDCDTKTIYHMETIHHRKFWLIVLLTNGKIKNAVLLSGVISLPIKFVKLFRKNFNRLNLLFPKRDQINFQVSA